VACTSPGRTADQGVAAGCSGGGSAVAPGGPEKPDLNVAVVPALDSAGFFVALYGNQGRRRPARPAGGVHNAAGTARTWPDRRAQEYVPAPGR
jgi:hypothetical protein